MRNGFVGAFMSLFATAGLVLSDEPRSSGPVPTPGAAAPINVQTPPLPENGATPDDAGKPSYFGNGNGAAGPRFWVKAEYLLWWIKGDSLPPLVTTGPATLPGPVIGAPGTEVLFGGDSSDPGPLSGGRLTVGFWLNCCQTKGIELSYFFLGSRSNDFTASSDGSVVLGRPFFDVSTGTQEVELIAFPGLLAGSVSVHAPSSLQGADSNLVCNLCQSCDTCGDCCGPSRGYRVDLLTGFRYLDLNEELRIDESSRGLGPLAGLNPTAFDQFNTHNQFFGPQIGIRAEVRRNRLFAEFTGKVALGTTRQTVDIDGFTTFNPPIAGLGGPGGLLALPSNIGHYSRNVFTVVPEATINIGCQLTNNLRAYVGYNFLYWSNVERPGDAIDFQVNSTRTPGSLVPPTGPLAPQFSFHGSDFWTQGINVGMHLRF